MHKPVISIRDKLFSLILPVVLFSVGVTLLLNILFIQRAQRRIADERTGLTEEQISIDLEIRHMTISAILISGGGGILLYVVLFLSLEKNIIKPIENLLKSTRRIADDKDFQTRVPPTGENEIGQLIVTFNEMSGELARYYRDLEASNQELARFAYVVSHDLQEPLRTVGCFVERLAQHYEGKTDEKAEQYIHYAVEGVTRMQKIIQGLLDYSKLQGQADTTMSVDSREALEEALLNLQEKISAAQGRIEYDPKALPKVLFDYNQLMRVWQNLIANAIRFRGDKPPVVKIEVQEKGDEFIFAVSDNGIGIEPHHQERIFGLFQRLDGQDDSAGAGIGLAISKRLIERHGGEIWLQSQAGQGSTFYFSAYKGDIKDDRNQEKS